MLFLLDILNHPVYILRRYVAALSLAAGWWISRRQKNVIVIIIIHFIHTFCTAHYVENVESESLEAVARWSVIGKVVSFKLRSKLKAVWLKVVCHSRLYTVGKASLSETAVAAWHRKQIVINWAEGPLRLMRYSYRREVSGLTKSNWLIRECCNFELNSLDGWKPLSCDKKRGSWID